MTDTQHEPEGIAPAGRTGLRATQPWRPLVAPEARDDQSIRWALGSRMLPWLQGDRPAPVLLVEAPLRVPPSTRVEPCERGLAQAPWDERGGEGRRSEGGHRLEVHSAVEVGCVLDGTAHVQVMENVLVLPAGTFFVVPGGVPHLELRPPVEEPDGRGPRLARCVTFWLSVLPCAAFCHVCATSGPAYACTAHHGSLFDSRFHTMAELLVDQLRGSAPEMDKVARSELVTLLLYLEQDLVSGRRPTAVPEGSAPPPSLAECSRRVRLACEYVEGRLGDPLTLAAIAQHACVSVSHLKRLFRSELRMGVWEYVIERRMAAAAFLLRETDLPIRDVSRLLGFSQPSSFTDRFSQWSGATPSDYRARHQEP